MSSQPTTPGETASAPLNADGVSAGLEQAIASGTPPLSRINTSSSVGAGTGTASPVTGSPAIGGVKRGHSRQASLGTTMTSPSTRRRSLESTMSLIQGVLEGTTESANEDDQMDGLTSRLAGSSVQNGPGRGPTR